MEKMTSEELQDIEKLRELLRIDAEQNVNDVPAHILVLAYRRFCRIQAASWLVIGAKQRSVFGFGGNQAKTKMRGVSL